MGERRARDPVKCDVYCVLRDCVWQWVMCEMDTLTLLGYAMGGAVLASLLACVPALHVYNVADRVVVIDRGRVAGEFFTKNIGLTELMDKMVRVAETGSLD